MPTKFIWDSLMMFKVRVSTIKEVHIEAQMHGEFSVIAYISGSRSFEITRKDSIEECRIFIEELGLEL